jgi:hypothetical protein
MFRRTEEQTLFKGLVEELERMSGWNREHNLDLANHRTEARPRPVGRSDRGRLKHVAPCSRPRLGFVCDADKFIVPCSSTIAIG